MKHLWIVAMVAAIVGATPALAESPEFETIWTIEQVMSAFEAHNLECVAPRPLTADDF